MEVNEPDVNRTYTYAEYLTWQFETQFELIKGKVFKMSPAPKRIHQDISGTLFYSLYHFLDKQKCKVYAAPFDVRLAKKNTKNKDIKTVVQPDICVICDESKLDEAGCIGAPDIVVEILSKGNNRKELNNKYEVYEEAGVLEYWIISPDQQTLLIYTLVDGHFQAGRLLTSGDFVTTPVLPGFVLNLETIFKGIN